MKFLKKSSRVMRERAIVLHYLRDYTLGSMQYLNPQDTNRARSAVNGLNLLATEVGLFELVAPAPAEMLERQLPWFARELCLLAVATPADDGWVNTGYHKEEFQAAAEVVIRLLNFGKPKPQEDMKVISSEAPAVL